MRPENVTRDGSVKLNVTNNENLGMNTLVHGKVGGVKNVVCKFAEWCNYKKNAMFIGLCLSLTVNFLNHSLIAAPAFAALEGLG